LLDLRTINANRFALAKRLWTFSITIKVLIFVVGVYSVFEVGISRYMPFILIVMAVASECLQWYSDIIKSRSESLLRNLDLCLSFDWEISATDKREIVSFVPKKLRDKFDVTKSVQSYFASKESPGPRKAIENLIESAWYTRKQAGVMTVICIVVCLTAFLLSIIVLMIASQDLNNLSTREGINKVVTSWLLLLFSLGLFRYGWGYFKLHQRCIKTEASSQHLLSSDSIVESDAVKQWYEYQIVRSSSPLLPQWLWSVYESSLNDAWERETQAR
jgi:hypothetical protein